MNTIIDVFEHSIMITIFVFVMMLFVDYLNVLTKGNMDKIISGKNRLKQYFTASFFGSIPGCLGAFMNVSLYERGLLSFGALAAGMIATSGDEAFVMLALFPKQAILLFIILFIVGIASGYMIDKITYIFKIKFTKPCCISQESHGDECRCFDAKETVESFKNLSLSRFLILFLLFGALYGLFAGIIGPHDWNWKKITLTSLLLLANFIVITVPEHYLEEHIWQHIVKKHLWQIFLWSFGALLFVNVGFKFWNLEVFVEQHMVWVLLIAALTGIIPESGPNLLFVMLFVNGTIPFSVLLTSSIVQDGHGMLPLFAYSLKDSLWIKLFNLIIGLGLGLILFIMGY
ncbi:MAG: putative manganese transporter [Elusimicrobiota bacterium]|nr:putative manganese transporter [Elusimicrobiota bacterium]